MAGAVDQMTTDHPRGMLLPALLRIRRGVDRCPVLFCPKMKARGHVDGTAGKCFEASVVNAPEVPQAIPLQPGPEIRVRAYSAL